MADTSTAMSSRSDPTAFFWRSAYENTAAIVSTASTRHKDVSERLKSFIGSVFIVVCAAKHNLSTENF